MKTFAPLLSASAAILVLAGCATTSSLDIQGHRGARGLAPENTLPAFERALALGVTTLELDVGVSADGVVVVTHDSSLNPDIARGPDGKWLDKRGPAIHEMTAAEVAQYDVGRLKAGTNYAKRYPEQVAVDGTRIPRLSEVFALTRTRGNDAVRFNIEIKMSPHQPGETLDPATFARALIAEVRRSRMETRTTIQSFDWRALRMVQREAPRIETVYLTAQQRFLDNICTGPQAGKASIAVEDCGPSAWTAGVQMKDHGSVPKMVRAAGGRIWSPDYRDLTPERLKEAHGLDLRVIVWTVNDPEHIKRMIAMGVDGIISDRPDLVKKLVSDTR